MGKLFSLVGIPTNRNELLLGNLILPVGIPTGWLIGEFGPRATSRGSKAVAAYLLGWLEKSVK